MRTGMILLAILNIIIAIATVVLVMMQEGNSQGLGTIGGGASDTFFKQNKGRSIDSLLKKITTILVVVFVIITITLNMMH